MADPIRAVLAEIRAAEDKATPAPWEAGDELVLSAGEAIATVTGQNNAEIDDTARLIAGARTWLPALREAVEAVLEMHQPVPHVGPYHAGSPACSTCGTADDFAVPFWPCPTVAAITAKLAPLLAGGADE